MRDIQNLDHQEFIEEVVNLVENTKSNVVSFANSSLTILFWKIGNKVLNKTLENTRAEYGKQIIVTLSRELESQFGRNYEEKNLRRMIQFAQQFSDFEKVVTLSRQLSWSHFLSLIPLKSIESQTFYAIKSYENGYSVRELRRQIAKKAFERTENADLQLTKTKVQYQGIFKDPYLLDFLELKEGYLENDLEKSILKELENFILELGNGFTFVERQKRMIIDGEDFYLDLLFFHRKLKRLVAIELKIGKFKASHKGQMELYLKWLDRYEKEVDENPPIGLILCAEASKEQIELLQMHEDGIMVAEYWTELPPKEMLEEKLHQYLIEAKERLGRNELRNKNTE